MVQAVVRSSKTQIVDISEQRCRIKVKAPPVEGAANLALSEFIAKAFGLAKRSVRLLSGHKGRKKSFLLVDVDLQIAAATLEKVLKGNGGEQA